MWKYSKFQIFSHGAQFNPSYPILMRPSRGQINKKSDNQRSKIPLFKDSTTSILAQKHVYKTNKAIGYVLRKPYIVIASSVGRKVCHDHNLRPRHAAN